MLLSIFNQRPYNTGRVVLTVTPPSGCSYEVVGFMISTATAARFKFPAGTPWGDELRGVVKRADKAAAVTAVKARNIALAALPVKLREELKKEVTLGGLPAARRGRDQDTKMKILVADRATALLESERWDSKHPLHLDLSEAGLYKCTAGLN